MAKPGANTVYSNNTTTPSGRSSSDDDAPKAALQDEGEGSFISKDFRPSAEQMAEALIDATQDEIDFQIRLFIAYNADRGSFSENWSTTWTLWWTRHLERKAKEAAKAPPRLVVNANAPYVPSEKDFRDGLKRFANGQQWSFAALGPEPGHRGCKVPPELIREFGIDPTDGRPMPKVKAS